MASSQKFNWIIRFSCWYWQKENTMKVTTHFNAKSVTRTVTTLSRNETCMHMKAISVSKCRMKLLSHNRIKLTPVWHLICIHLISVPSGKQRVLFLHVAGWALARGQHHERQSFKTAHNQYSLDWNQKSGKKSLWHLGYYKHETTSKQ